MQSPEGLEDSPLKRPADIRLFTLEKIKAKTTESEVFSMFKFLDGQA